MNRKIDLGLRIAILSLLFISFVLLTSSAQQLRAQQTGQKAASGDGEKGVVTTPSAVDELSIRQGRLADKYANLERLMLRLAEDESGKNPRRAALLRDAVTQSEKSLTRLTMESLVKLLGQRQLARASENQEVVRQDLNKLLELLQSEDQSEDLKSKRARTKEYIEELERLIRKQRSLQGQTEGGADAERLAKDQGKLAGRSGDLAEKIRKNEENPEEQKTPDSESQSESEDDQSDDPKSEDPAPGDPKLGDSKPGEAKPGDSKPGEAKPGEAKPGEAKPPQDDANPARKHLEEAQQRMREAQKRLEEAKRDDARDEQEQAREALADAIEELKKILRQLREEEIERALAMLEARFQKMLEMEMAVYEDTKHLSTLDSEVDARALVARSGQLSSRQHKIVLDANRALSLLQEEGSSIAFPEVVEDVRDEMMQVEDRLAAVKVYKLTQEMEEDIIAVLQELVEALQKAQQELKDEKEGEKPLPGDGPPGKPGEPPLVNAIAELKMIRSMQLRVNKRTRRYAILLDDSEDVAGQATKQELLDALDTLATREERIHRITRDIVLKKNR